MTRAVRPSGRTFWLRWSLRDFRQHWAAVVAIALVIAIGTGMFAGLGSTATWRRQSNDASFAALNIHDLRLALSPGTTIDEGALVAAIASSDIAIHITDVDERLVLDNQVEAVTGEGAVLVVAELVGTAPDAVVDTVWLSDGTDDDAILETKFAEYYDLAATGTVTIAGGHDVAYSGLGVGPEHLYYSGPEGSIFGQGELAIVYTDLDELQSITGNDGRVNDAVISLVDGADRDSIRTELEALANDLGISAIVTTTDDVEAYQVLYDDIENDQQVWNAISALILGAAALAAFNLVSRIVEAQRREIGIGMAMGVSKAKLSIRPLLVGAQVAVLGTAAGVGVGLLVGALMGDLLESVLPMPVHVHDFQLDVFARAAALGIIVPIAASALPVWRAVRVEPVYAIRTGHLAAKSSRLTDWTRRIRLPGTSLTQMPIRNILRTPRRTLLTAFGVGAAITALVGVLGMLDSFEHTIGVAGDELTKGDSDRIVVQLDGFYTTDSDEVNDLRTAPEVDTLDAGLRLAVTIPVDQFSEQHGVDDDLVLILDLVDFDSASWTPTVTDGSADGGLVLAQKALDDLGVDLGDHVIVRHPRFLGDGTVSMSDTPVPVTGVHANPIRTFAYGDLAAAELAGLSGTTNLLTAYPADGATRTDVQRAAFGAPGVATTQAVARLSEAFDEALEQFVSILVIAAGAVLALAMLIAFNATRISVEERRREHATMMAYGLPVRTVLGVIVRESVVLGAIATVIGVVAGTVFTGWMLASIMASTLPDLGMIMYLSPTTIVLALLVGIVAVATAPLFLVRRIRRMNIPDNLRVME